MARPSAVIRIEALCQTHDDYELFASLPGAGPVYAARLTAALGSDRSRWTSADELVRFSGIAPIIERSGKQNWIRWKYFCPKFFRQTFHEYAAAVDSRFFLGARLLLDAARQREATSCGGASTGFQVDPIIWKCWQTRTPYNEVVYLESLRKKGSSLLNFAANNPS